MLRNRKLNRIILLAGMAMIFLIPAASCFGCTGDGGPADPCTNLAQAAATMWGRYGY